MRRVPAITADGPAGATRWAIAPASYVAPAAAAAALIVYLSVWGRRYGLDLSVYRDAVLYWGSGHDPYLADFTVHHLAFTYPPFAFLLLLPLSWPSFAVAGWVLWAASIAAATGSVILILRERGLGLSPSVWRLALAWSCAAGIVLEPARTALDYGQIEFILMFAVVADLLLVPRRYRGILIGAAAAVKLTPLIFAAFLIANKDFKSAARAAATFVGCTAISWILWPGYSQEYWFHEMSDAARVGTIAYSGNQSWYAVFHRPPLPLGGSTFAWLLVSLLVIILAIFIAWRCMSDNMKPFAVISVALAGLLVSPISWTHHWLWLILVPPIIAVRRKPGEPRSVRILLWSLVVLVAAAPYWWFGHGIPAYAADAILPLWTSVILAIWAIIEFRAWRSNSRLSMARTVIAVSSADQIPARSSDPR